MVEVEYTLMQKILIVIAYVIVTIIKGFASFIFSQYFLMLVLLIIIFFIGIWGVYSVSRQYL